MTRSSGACERAKEDAQSEGGSGNVRMSSITCGLQRVLRFHDVLAPHLKEYAASIGVMRHVVSMVANHVALSEAPVEKGDLFLFYTRVWSAVDRHARNEIGGAITHFDSEVAQFFREHETRGLPSFLVPVMCRQQECNSLATAAYRHLQSFPDRMHRWIGANVASFFRGAGPAPTNIPTIATKVWRVVSHVGDFSQSEMAKVVEDHPELAAVEQELVEFARREYDHLSGFRSGDTKLTSAMHSNAKAHLLVPHMIRVSTGSERLLRTMEVDTDGDSSDESDDAHGVRWPKAARPRPFTILPVATLKCAMVYYGFTEVKTMLSSMRAKGKKRSMDVRTFADTTYDNMDAATILESLFDFRKIKGKQRVGTEDDAAKWRLACFRTDGAKVVLTFCSGMGVAKAADHVCCLCEEGYSVPACDPVHLHDTHRGLYRVQPSRNDVASLDPSDAVTVVDPGFHRPVQWATVGGAHLLEQDARPEEMARHARFDHIDQATWLRQSKRQEREAHEQRRRETNRFYAQAIDLLSETRRKTCDFLHYSKVAMQTLAARAGELVTFARSMFRWKYERRLQSFLDTVADRLFDRSTSRASRTQDYRQLDESARDELRRRLRDAKALRAEKNVVFFGDGTFASTQRGHASIPKKQLLKQLAVRGPTILLCERYTSKRCPCGQCDLKNGETIGGTRVRVHGTDGGVCNVLRVVQDRDELACVDMLLAASSACRRASWPPHLLRRD